MGYIECIEAAGAEVHDSESQADYQGTSIALVTYKGRKGFISWSFGSCGGCDAYEGWVEDLGWDHVVSEEEKAEFGRRYLDSIMSLEEALRTHPPSDWDLEDTMNNFIRKHALDL